LYWGTNGGESLDVEDNFKRFCDGIGIKSQLLEEFVDGDKY